MPVLIQHAQSTTYYVPYWRQVFSDACFGWAYAGHHLLCHLLKTGVQWYLFWFSIRRTPPTMPPTNDRCSVVPVLIRHTQDTTYYATYWRQGQLCGGVRLSERPLQRADHQYILCGLSDVEGFAQNCLRQGRRQEHRDWGHRESIACRATEAETVAFFFNAVIDEDENGINCMMLLWTSTTW